MPTHDFTALYEQYPALIAEMPDTFTRHQFILRLAQQNQRLYVEALYAYRNHPHRGKKGAPFFQVHRILAQHLRAYPKQITYIGEVPSHDIFDYANNCSEWRQVK